MAGKIVMAIGAHPDDIEFCMAGTLLMLARAGYQAHYMSLASGNCGSSEYNASATRAIRNTEARAAAKVLGAAFHPPMSDDLELFYCSELLRPLAAVIREVQPSIILTHSPQDYMEDHMITSRLAVTAAFARGMPNFRTTPTRPAVESDVTVYHAMPYGLCDGLRRRIVPGAFVNTTPVHKLQHQALAAHKSQQRWLDASQGLSCFLLTMENMSLEVGKLSKRFKYAEGWRRHVHLGFSSEDIDPLAAALGRNYRVNKSYEQSLSADCGP